MSKMLEPMINEFRQEGATTRRVLERVPGDKLTWKPHPKSLCLGSLALHIASVPAGITKIAQLDGFDVSQTNFAFPCAKDTAEILSTFDASQRTAEQYLSQLSDSDALASWRMSSQEKEIFTVPRAALLRMIMMNHLYHHRGQLSVYLRMLDVPIPSIYGPSADDNPFV